MHHFLHVRMIFKEKELPDSRSLEQQMEKLSGTGYRLSHYCVMSISDSKEDIYLCENATDSYLRFWSSALKPQWSEWQNTQTALLKHRSQSFHILHINQFISQIQIWGPKKICADLGLGWFSKIFSKHPNLRAEQATEAVSQFRCWTLQSPHV